MAFRLRLRLPNGDVDGLQRRDGHPFDPYPFILLNLALSTLAGLQGAILLIAAKRADRISSELAKYHLEVSEATRQMLAEHRVMLEELRKAN